MAGPATLAQAGSATPRAFWRRVCQPSIVSLAGAMAVKGVSISKNIKDLEEKLRCVRQQLSASRQACKLEKQRVRRQWCSQEATHFQTRVALHIFAMTNFKTDAASEYLHGKQP